MIYTIKPGAQMSFFWADFSPAGTIPVSEYHLTAWGMSAQIYQVGNKKYVLIYKKDLLKGPNGQVPGWMGIDRAYLDPIRMSAASFQTTIHGCASKIENDMRCISGTPQYVSGPVKYALCTAKCAVLHPFNKDKREECKAGCAALLSSPDTDTATPPTLPVDPPPPVLPHLGPLTEVSVGPLPFPVGPGPGPGPNPNVQPGSMELISLDDLKFIYKKILNFFTNK